MIDLPSYTYPLVTDDNKTNKVKAKTKIKRKKRQRDIDVQVRLNYDHYCKLPTHKLQALINKLTPAQQLIFARTWDDVTTWRRHHRLLDSLPDNAIKH